MKSKLQLEVGGTYLRRDGVTVSIVRKNEGALFPFLDEYKTSYQANGKYQVSTYHVSPYDLIQEVHPEQTAIKHGDATLIYSKEDDKHEIILPR